MAIKARAIKAIRRTQEAVVGSSRAVVDSDVVVAEEVHPAVMVRARRRSSRTVGRAHTTRTDHHAATGVNSPEVHHQGSSTTARGSRQTRLRSPRHPSSATPLPIWAGADHREVRSEAVTIRAPRHAVPHEHPTVKVKAIKVLRHPHRPATRSRATKARAHRPQIRTHPAHRLMVRAHMPAMGTPSKVTERKRATALRPATIKRSMTTAKRMDNKVTHKIIVRATVRRVITAQ